MFYSRHKVKKDVESVDHIAEMEVFDKSWKINIT